MMNYENAECYEIPRDVRHGDWKASTVMFVRGCGKRSKEKLQNVKLLFISNPENLYNWCSNNRAGLLRVEATEQRRGFVSPHHERALFLYDVTNEMDFFLREIRSNEAKCIKDGDDSGIEIGDFLLQFLGLAGWCGYRNPYSEFVYESLSEEGNVEPPKEKVTNPLPSPSSLGKPLAHFSKSNGVETASVPAGIDWKAFSIKFQTEKASDDPYKHLCFVSEVTISNPRALFRWADFTRVDAIGSKISAGPSKEEAEKLNLEWSITKSFLQMLVNHLEEGTIVVSDDHGDDLMPRSFLIIFFWLLSLYGLDNIYSECYKKAPVMVL